MPSKSKQSKAKVSTHARKSVRPKAPDPLPPPQWPPLEPLIPPIDLSLEVLSNNQIVVIRNFFTSTLCRKCVSFLSSQPLVTTPTTPKAGDAVRVNDRVQFDDFAFSQHLWQAAGLEWLMKNAEIQSQGDNSEDSTKCDWGGDPCGLNPRIRVYRYSEGQFFGQHCKSVRILL